MNVTLMHVEHLRKLIPKAKRELAVRGDFGMGSFRCGAGDTDMVWRSEWIAELENTLAMEEAKLSAQLC